MDSHESIRFVRDFAERIRLISTDRAQERFVRDFVSKVALDCPLPILSQIAARVLELRSAELREAGDCN